MCGQTVYISVLSLRCVWADSVYFGAVFALCVGRHCIFWGLSLRCVWADSVYFGAVFALCVGRQCIFRCCLCVVCGQTVYISVLSLRCVWADSVYFGAVFALCVG